MKITETFEEFAADFEAAVGVDDWSRLKKELAEHATYLNVGGPNPKARGRDAIIASLNADVSSIDRRVDSRTLIALTPPKAKGNRLTRQWRCIYTLAGTPDLVVEGEARYRLEGDLTKEIEEEVTPDSMRRFDEWMNKHGEELNA